MTLEEVLADCRSHDIACEIKREPIMQGDGVDFEKATVDFTNLKYVEKNRMIDQLKNLQASTSLQWRDLYPIGK